MLSCLSKERENQCLSLSNFTKDVHKEIIQALFTLGWTTKNIKDDNDNRLICPYDSSHQIGKTILDQHLESCQWKQEGYNEWDISLPESTLPTNSSSSIKLDAVTQNSILQEARKNNQSMKIENYECPTWHKLYILSKHEFLTLMIGLGDRLIPQTSDRIFTDLTCDERKILYDYVISNTMKVDIGNDITDIQKLSTQGQEDKKLSFLELLIQERNLKRRRAKHKGIHTNKKSHTEILREVIQQQMELYIDYIRGTRSTAEYKKPATIEEKQSLSKSFDDIHKPSSPVLLNEVSTKHRKSHMEQWHEFHESSSTRNGQKHKYFDKSYDSYRKHSDQRDEHSHYTSESVKTHKHRKRKRSRSREHEYNKKNKCKSTDMYYKTKKEHKMKRKRKITE